MRVTLPVGKPVANENSHAVQAPSPTNYPAISGQEGTIFIVKDGQLVPVQVSSQVVITP